MRCGFAVPPPDADAGLRLDSAENVLHPLQNLAGLLRVERVNDGADRLHLRIERIYARCRQAGVQLAEHFIFLEHSGLRAVSATPSPGSRQQSPAVTADSDKGSRCNSCRGRQT